MKKVCLLALLFCLTFVSSVSQRIFLTGDSHVSGKVYPLALKALVTEAKPSANVSFWGKGGAGFYTFNETPAYMDSISQAQPDILIVHLGTNGCYNVPVDSAKTLSDITIFHRNVRARLPRCRIVYVTPFYNKNREVASAEGEEKVYGPWKVNEKTRKVADIILDFALAQPFTYVIDNNADAGTVFLDREGLIRDDNIHLTREGYELLGRQVADRLLQIPDLWQD